MTPAIGISIWLAEALLIAALSARPAGARVALAFAVLMLPYPFLIDAIPFVRALFAVAAAGASCGRRISCSSPRRAR